MPDNLKYNEEMLRKFVRETPDVTAMDLQIGDYEFKGVTPYVDDMTPDEGKVYITMEIDVVPWKTEEVKPLD